MWQSFIHLLMTTNYLLLVSFSLGAGIVGLLVGRIWRGKWGKGSKGNGKRGDEAFFKGIQYILSDDRDQAIEALTKSVQSDSDTVETYVALGNLYRSKGDIERAIRIRQSIILRPNIDEELRLRALFDLGLDYKKAGLINRALDTFLEVLKKSPSDVRTLMEIEKIYEELKEWENAYDVRKRIAKLDKGDHSNILAHHLVESGKAAQARGDHSKAKSLYKKAISTNKQCVDAYLHLGDLHAERGEYKKAISMWKNIASVDNRFTFLAYGRLEGVYSKLKNIKPIEEFLKELAEENGDPFTYLALSRFLFAEGNVEGALKEVRKALELEPGFWEARRFQGEILIESGRESEALAAFRELISYLDLPSIKFQCSNCGLEGVELYWQCPKCRAWDTMAPL